MRERIEQPRPRHGNPTWSWGLTRRVRALAFSGKSSHTHPGENSGVDSYGILGFSFFSIPGKWSCEESLT